MNKHTKVLRIIVLLVVMFLTVLLIGNINKNYVSSQNIDNNSSTSINDESSIDIMMNNIKSISGTFEAGNIDYVYDSYSDQKLILIDGADKSLYFLYDLENQEIVKYDLLNNSPWYENQTLKETVKVYDSFKNYFCIIEKNELKNLVTNSSRKLTEIEQTKINSYVESMNETTRFNTIDTTDFDDRTVYQSKKIKNGFFFDNSDLTEKYNEHNSCSIVAACILLSYYDTLVSSNVFVEETGKENYYINNITCSNSDLDCFKGNAMSTYSVGPTKAFHDDFFDYCTDKGYSFILGMPAVWLTDYTDSYLNSKGSTDTDAIYISD